VARLPVPDHAYVDVADAIEGEAVARSLRERGLVAALAPHAHGWLVEVRSHDGPSSFLADLCVGVAASTPIRTSSPDGGSDSLASRLGRSSGDRDAASRELHSLLLALVWFEFDRRAAQLARAPAVRVNAAARDAADRCCSSALARLEDFRGQSRFLLWAAKFAVHEAAVAARAIEADAEPGAPGRSPATDTGEVSARRG
jgi:hypothetical protein